MLRPRVIPCLLVKGKGLVKTRQFTAPKYVGDPINAVRIFNEKSVDELIVLDISATAEGREPDYTLIRNLAAECRMPLCYGGGINSVAQAEAIISLGVEKIAVSSAAILQPGLVAEMAARLGSQSVVVVLDVRRDSKRDAYQVWMHNGRQATGLDAMEFAAAMVARGAGEIVVNSIDRDGEMSGYDLDLMTRVRDTVTVPITALGGAGSVHDMRALIAQVGVVGAAAGSLFVFKGALRAVLISYPPQAERDALAVAALAG